MVERKIDLIILEEVDQVLFMYLVESIEKEQQKQSLSQ